MQRPDNSIFWQNRFIQQYNDKGKYFTQGRPTNLGTILRFIVTKWLMKIQGLSVCVLSVQQTDDFM